jgi:AcrR family transcriptional regulator
MNKKNKIFLAARKLFVERGFHATPTSLIAEEAGVASGTIFYYFKTKEEMINQLYLDRKSAMLEHIKNGVEGQGSIRAAVRRLWLNFITWGLSDQEDYFFIKLYSNSTFIDSLTREEALKGYEFVNRLIEQGKREEVLKNIDTEMIMNISLGTIYGTIDFLIENNMQAKLDDSFYNDVFQMFWDALKL